MYIDIVPKLNSPPFILLRESHRVGKKVKKRTLANLTSWPPELIENFRVLLKGGVAVKDLAECFEVVREWPHGHVAAVLGTLRWIGLENSVDGGSNVREFARTGFRGTRLIRSGQSTPPSGCQ